MIKTSPLPNKWSNPPHYKRQAQVPMLRPKILVCLRITFATHNRYG